MSVIKITVKDAVGIILNNDEILDLVKQDALKLNPPEFDLSELEELVAEDADEGDDGEEEGDGEEESEGDDEPDSVQAGVVKPVEAA